jgi:NAD dependent epimerase/dehydratase family enzyme
MADVALLASQRVEPARLAGTGYLFQFPQLTGTLQNLLGRR